MTFDKIFPRFLHILLVLSLVIGIAFADVVTGSETHLYPLYFIPLLISGRWLGKNWTLVLSQVCTIVWLLSKILEGTHFSSMVYWFVNLIAQWVALTTVAILINNLQAKILREQKDSQLDQLTNLPNRFGLFTHANRIIKACHLKGAPLAFAIIGLDNFKKLNSEHGRHRGNEVLQIAANTIKSALRNGDFLCRLGGDEFILILPDASNDVAKVTLERVLQAVRDKMVSEKCEVTATIGAAVYLYAPKDVNRMIFDVDSELLIAKQSGKNTLRIVSN